ncbi:MAG: SRPBCC family protein [Kofleriaceae bacterium]
MARYITSVATPLSPDTAFSFMADVTRFTEWDPGVERAVQVAGEGPGVGAAYDLTVRTIGRTVMRYEVETYEAPRRLRLVSQTRFVTSVDEVRVERDGTGSVVTYDATLTLRGRLALFDRLLHVAFTRIGDRAAAGLRRALGGSARAAPHANGSPATSRETAR